MGRMGTLRIVKIATAAAGALLVSGAVVAITASAAGLPAGLIAAASPSPKPSGHAPDAAKQAYCQAFINNFASDLGKKPADVEAAAKKAFGQTVDQAVKDGKLTAAQADQLKQKAANGNLCTGMGVAGIGRPAAGDHGMGALGAMYVGEAAKVLGMSQADLQAALRGGQTLQQVAQSKGMNEQQFRDKLVAQVKTDLDAQVKNGKLTQAQEDEVLNRLKTAPLPLWNTARPARPTRPTATPSSSTT